MIELPKADVGELQECTNNRYSISYFL